MHDTATTDISDITDITASSDMASGPPPAPRPRLHRRLAARVRRSELGEGVISAAIAVLIMAFLGAAMYLTYSRILNKAGTKTDGQVCQIGSDPAAGPAPTSC